MPPEISVVVATYNRGHAMMAVVSRLLAMPPGPSFEVLVVDQTDRHSDDVRTSIQALSEDPRLRYFHVAPASLPAARNFGTERARAEVVLFLDDDVAPDEGLLTGHLRAHRAEAAPACVAGRVRGERTGSGVLFRFGRLGANVGDFDHDMVGPVPTARGCNMSFRREWLERLGGFDTRFAGNAYREESDLCLRLTSAGGTIAFAPAASVLHHELDEGGCREGTDIHDLPTAYRNETLFLLKNFPRRRVPLMLAAVLRSQVFGANARRRRVVALRARSFVRGVAQGVRAATTPSQITLLERVP